FELLRGERLVLAKRRQREDADEDKDCGDALHDLLPGGLKMVVLSEVEVTRRPRGDAKHGPGLRLARSSLFPWPSSSTTPSCTRATRAPRPTSSPACLACPRPSPLALSSTSKCATR